MRNIKEYKAPKAAITEFECADVITVSALDKTNGHQDDPTRHTYVNAGGRKWGDITSK